MTSPFCEFLVESWRARLFSDAIFPGFPFKSEDWVAVAFNRDNSGDTRLPSIVWRTFLSILNNSVTDRKGFVVSPEVLLGGTVSNQEQPFVVALDEVSVMSHFENSATYLPSFFMAGVSEQWAIWGDSDFTLLGGEKWLILEFIDELGGVATVIRGMFDDFGVNASEECESMRNYLSELVMRVRSGEAKGSAGSDPSS